MFFTMMLAALLARVKPYSTMAPPGRIQNAKKSGDLGSSDKWHVLSLTHRAIPVPDALSKNIAYL